MWTGGFAGYADFGNFLTLGDFFAGRNKKFSGMSIERFCAVWMRNNHIVAIAAIPAASPRYDDSTIRSSIYWISNAES